MNVRRRNHYLTRLHIRKQDYNFESVLVNISDEILQDELDKMLFLLSNVIPGSKRETIKKAYEVFECLKTQGLIQETNVTYLVGLLKDIKREDLAKTLKHHNAHKLKPHKCIVVGESSSGKTALTLRLMYNLFPDSYKVTINPDCVKRNIYLKEKSVLVEMWDTAGMETLSFFLPNQFFRDVSVVLIVFDITDKSSFEMTTKWREEVRLKCSESAVILLIGNKMDLDKTRVITRQMGKKKAEEFGAVYLEASAKDGGYNTETILTEIAKALPPEEMFSDSIQVQPLTLRSTDAATQTPTMEVRNGRRWRRPFQHLRSCQC